MNHGELGIECLFEWEWREQVLLQLSSQTPILPSTNLQLYE